MKKQDKSKATPKYDSQRETRVLLEQIRSEVKIVAEQYGDIVKRLDRIDSKLQEHDPLLFKLEMGLETVKSRIGTIDTKVDRIEKGLEAVKVIIKDINTRVDEKMAGHERRIKELETVR